MLAYNAIVRIEGMPQDRLGFSGCGVVQRVYKNGHCCDVAFQREGEEGIWGNLYYHTDKLHDTGNTYIGDPIVIQFDNAIVRIEGAPRDHLGYDGRGVVLGYYNGGRHCIVAFQHKDNEGVWRELSHPTDMLHDTGLIYIGPPIVIQHDNTPAPANLPARFGGPGPN